MRGLYTGFQDFKEFKTDFRDSKDFKSFTDIKSSKGFTPDSKAFRSGFSDF